MPYVDNDKMINDLLSSMNLGVGITQGMPRDKTSINAQLAKTALEYKILTPEDDEKLKDSQKTKDKGEQLLIKDKSDSSDATGGNDFNINNDDIAGMIQSMMA